MPSQDLFRVSIYRRLNIGLAFNFKQHLYYRRVYEISYLTSTSPVKYTVTAAAGEQYYNYGNNNYFRRTGLTRLSILYQNLKHQ